MAKVKSPSKQILDSPTSGAVAKFLALSDEAKEVVYSSIDREIGDDETTLATAEDVRRWETAVASGKARGRGRPRVGKGAERVNVTIERSLLKLADAYAAKNSLSRAQAIARDNEAVWQ